MHRTPSTPTRRSRRHRGNRRPWAAWLAALLCLLFAGCGEQSPAAPPADPPTGPQDPLLVVDGVTITFADVEGPQRFLASLYPQAGRATKLRRVLEEHVLPLALARRAFAAEREAQRHLAVELCSVAGNVYELEQHARLRRLARKVSGPRDLDLPLAEFLFDPLHLLAVSPPIEVPRGFVVAAAFELMESALTIDDRCDALMVGFFTHDTTAFKEWLAAEQQRVGSLTTWVHPLYRDAMPSWIVLPRS